jgi:hypothetical protein
MSSLSSKRVRAPSASLQDYTNAIHALDGKLERVEGYYVGKLRILEQYYDRKILSLEDSQLFYPEHHDVEAYLRDSLKNNCPGCPSNHALVDLWAENARLKKRIEGLEKLTCPCWHWGRRTD